MEQKIGRILSDFSFTNFVGVGLYSYVNISGRIRSLEKHSPLISALCPSLRSSDFTEYGSEFLTPRPDPVFDKSSTPNHTSSKKT